MLGTTKPFNSKNFHVETLIVTIIPYIRSSPHSFIKFWIYIYIYIYIYMIELYINLDRKFLSVWNPSMTLHKSWPTNNWEALYIYIYPELPPLSRQLALIFTQGKWVPNWIAAYNYIKNTLLWAHIWRRNDSWKQREIIMKLFSSLITQTILISMITLFIYINPYVCMYMSICMYVYVCVDLDFCSNDLLIWLIGKLK